MLNCRWSLENERSSECWGGANQTVKAVLEALGTNYIVEKWVNEDGTQKYQRWADGEIEIWMKLQVNTSDGLPFVFPIAFTELPVVKCNETEISTAKDRYLYDGYKELSTTGGRVLFVQRTGDLETVTSAMLYACGY